MVPNVINVITKTAKTNKLVSTRSSKTEEDIIMFVFSLDYIFDVFFTFFFSVRLRHVIKATSI